MSWSGALLAGALALVCADQAFAQTVEIGGSVGSACVMSDGSLCDSSEGRRFMPQGHLRLWVGERFDVTTAVGRVGLEDRGGLLSPEPGRVTITDRSRTFLSAVGTFHFFPSAAVRPLIGLGLGLFAHHQTVTCEPSPCSGTAATLDFYRDGRRWRPDILLVAGIGGAAGDRWRWRAGWETHRLFNDENSTHQLFLAAGWLVKR